MLTLTICVTVSINNLVHLFKTKFQIFENYERFLVLFQAFFVQACIIFIFNIVLRRLKCTNVKVYFVTLHLNWLMGNLFLHIPVQFCRILIPFIPPDYLLHNAMIEFIFVLTMSNNVISNLSDSIDPRFSDELEWTSINLSVHSS